MSTGETRASIAITDSGARAGTEVVQLYAADTAAGITLPAQQLVGFARVHLEPGETKALEFTVPISLLAYTGSSGKVVMEPGPVEPASGSSSDDLHSTATFTMTGPTRAFNGADRAFLSTSTVGG